MRRKIDKSTNLLKNKVERLLGYGIWALVIIFLFSTIKNIGRVSNIRKQVAYEKERVEKMRAENIKLEEQIAEANSSAYIEKQIRDKLGLAKNGEVVVILPDNEIVKSLAPLLVDVENSLPDSNWVKWKKLFF